MEMFNVIELLGKGTYGTVHLCERLHNKHKVVVKKISTNLHGDQLTNAKNEVSILKYLKHPNIIEYYNNFLKSGDFYIVMEYANKGSLFQLIFNSRPRKFTPEFAMNIFCQILMGLDHIHSKKVIHRDLKCENIFLTGLNGDVVKIGDFGISKILQNSHTTNTVIGTCNYLAPELCDGKDYNSKSDIWALGCILYEICEMEKMFNGNISTVVLSIARGKKKSIDKEYYGEEVQNVIDLLLQANPDDRPDTKKLMSLPYLFPIIYKLHVNLGCLK